MTERQTIQESRIGLDRQFVTPMDEFRAAEYVSALVASASAYVSGSSLLTVVASNVVRMRPVNVHFLNREGSARTVVIRDGGIAGNIIGGPWILNPIQERDIEPKMLQGRYALSSFYMVVISGTYTSGIDVNIGYILEPLPTDVGGLLE